MLTLSCSLHTTFFFFFMAIFIAVAAFFLSVLIIFLSFRAKSKSPKLPPGPPGWPIVGNFLQFALSGKPIFQYVEEMKQICGPIFTLKLGARTLIFVCNPELAHEVLIEKGQTFASRPSDNLSQALFTSDKFNVNTGVYGPVWRTLRRNMVQGVFSSSRLKEFHSVRVLAVDKLIDRLRAESSSNNGAVWVLKHGRFAVFCILLSTCFGVEMDDETIEKIDALMKRILGHLGPRLDDYIPILSLFLAKQRKRAMQVREEEIRTLLPFIEKRRSAIQNPGSDPTAATFAYLDTLFDLKVDGRKSAPSDLEIVTLCSEFLNSGTDTTATILEWAIARLVDNPKIQDKLANEIKTVVGDRKVDDKDVEKMEYLNAFTKELLRKHPPTYFSLIHAVINDSIVGGYDVPTWARVVVHLRSISHDPTIWSNPDVFDPDRFISGGEKADITGTKEIKMIPFGAGRRICPGLGMATIHINLMIARMVQEFEWSTHPSQPKMDYSEKVEFTMMMKNTLQTVIKPRVR